IEIAAHPGAGAYQFSSCEPGFPVEPVFYTNPLFLNSPFVSDTDPPVILFAESTDQNHVSVRFDEPLFAETALKDGDFAIFEKDNPVNTVDLIPSSLTDGDRIITLFTTDLLVHGKAYTIRAGNVMDCRGNVMAETPADFVGLDTYPPEYTVCEVDPDRLWVMVCFSEPVHPRNATYIHSYFFYEDPRVYVEFEVIDAILQPDGKNVQVVFDSKFKAGIYYRLWVRHVKDLAGNKVRDDGRAYFKIPDTYPPEIIEIRGVAVDVLSVRFDEELDLATAVDPYNYEVLVEGDPDNIVRVTRVTTDVTDDWLYLFLAGSIETGVDHVLRYKSICDLIGNCIGSGGGPALMCGFKIDSSVGTMLEHYAAEYSGAGIELNWRLSTPAEESRFIILRTEGDNNLFTAIENPDIESDGTDFRFVDENIGAGFSYRYRVEYLSEEGRKLLFETGPVFVPAVSYYLSQNRPNPFNPVTEIVYSLPEAAHVTIEIFDVKGRRIKCLVDRYVQAGTHSTVWNGLDEENKSVASGIYFYSMKAGKWTGARKMILIR
ncbi:MAG: T9SS type A sorting domain-containing protein, partial [bacterium]